MFFAFLLMVRGVVLLCMCVVWLLLCGFGFCDFDREGVPFPFGSCVVFCSFLLAFYCGVPRVLFFFVVGARFLLQPVLVCRAVVV